MLSVHKRDAGVSGCRDIRLGRTAVRRLNYESPNWTHSIGGINVPKGDHLPIRYCGIAQSRNDSVKFGRHGKLRTGYIDEGDSVEPRLNPIYLGNVCMFRFPETDTKSTSDFGSHIEHKDIGLLGGAGQSVHVQHAIVRHRGPRLCAA